MATTTDLVKYLSRNNVEFSVRTHSPAFSAYELALANHMEERDVMVPVLFRTAQRLWMAVVPGNRSLDRAVMSNAVGSGPMEPAGEQEIQALCPGSEPAAIPPLGNLYGIPVIADGGFLRSERIVFSACSFTESVIMSWRDYSRLVKPIVAEISENS